MSNTVIALAQMLIAMREFKAVADQPEGIEKFQELQQFVATLEASKLDTIIVIALSQSDGDGSEVCSCGEDHARPVIDLRVLGDSQAASAMFLLGSAEHSEKAIAAAEGRTDPFDPPFQHAGGRVKH